jgi:hypothetical protein
VYPMHLTFESFDVFRLASLFPMVTRLPLPVASLLAFLPADTMSDDSARNSLWKRCMEVCCSSASYPHPAVP